MPRCRARRWCSIRCSELAATRRKSRVYVASLIHRVAGPAGSLSAVSAVLHLHHGCSAPDKSCCTDSNQWEPTKPSATQRPRCHVLRCPRSHHCWLSWYVSNSDRISSKASKRMSTASFPLSPRIPSIPDSVSCSNRLFATR